MLYFALLIYGTMNVSAQFFMPILCKGSPQSAAIAITFDDGPLPGKTDQILKILKAHNVSAAFFCIGNRVEKNPELLKQIDREGHIIGNHSFSHSASFDLQSSGNMSRELTSADGVISRIIGVRPAMFRPPYGVTNRNLANAVA